MNITIKLITLLVLFIETPFNKVYRGYKDIDSSKLTFLDDDFMKRHFNTKRGKRE